MGSSGSPDSTRQTDRQTDRRAEARARNVQEGMPTPMFKLQIESLTSKLQAPVVEIHNRGV